MWRAESDYISFPDGDTALRRLRDAGYGRYFEFLVPYAGRRYSPESLNIILQTIPNEEKNSNFALRLLSVLIPDQNFSEVIELWDHMRMLPPDQPLS